MSTGRPASRPPEQEAIEKFLLELSPSVLSPKIGLPVPTLKLLTVHPSQAIAPGHWLLDVLYKYCKSGGPAVGSDYNQLFWVHE